jgi:hypothetical protein
MGKGQIQSHIGDGQYSTKLIYSGRAGIETRITNLQAKITTLETKYNGMPESTPEEIFEKQAVGLLIVAYEKQVVVLQSFPDDPTMNIWCVDKTVDLTGDVATIEIDGENIYGSRKVQIRPGHTDAAVYDGSRDGQLQPSMAGIPWQVLFNRMALPGWQKWMPTYRYGKITPDSLDFDNGLCSICLDPAYSSQMNLDINQGQGFSENCEYPALAAFQRFCADNPAHPT